MYVNKYYINQYFSVLALVNEVIMGHWAKGTGYGVGNTTQDSVSLQFDLY